MVRRIPQHDLQVSQQHVQEWLVGVEGRPLALGLFCFLMMNVKRANSMDVPAG